MARNTLKLQMGGFEELISKLDHLQGDVRKAVTDAMEQAGETIGEDTIEAVEKSNLPAEGAYSKGNTENAIVSNPHVQWSGTQAEIGVGFDYSKKGAGGFLITGTPRMKPDYALQKIYKQKKYMNQIQRDMAEVVTDYITDKMEGKK